MYKQYDAVVSVENYKTEFAEILDFYPKITRPDDFGELNHSVDGGVSGSMKKLQEKVYEVVDSMPLEKRDKLKAYFGRDMTLFGYFWNTTTNDIGFKYKG